MKISLESLKKIKAKQAAYPVISICCVVAVAVIFFRSAVFISHTINSSFSVDDKSVEDAKLKIDLATYYTIARKLGISTPTPEPKPGENEDAGTSPQPSLEPGSSVSPSPSPSVSPSAKSSLSISVLNSTPTSGLAGELKTQLAQAGFMVSKTGNQTPVQAVTLIKVGSKVSDEVFAEIYAVVTQKYSGAKRETLESSSAFDIEIVIGSK